MAWVTPSNVATGDVLTASTWNQDVVENTSVLRSYSNRYASYRYNTGNITLTGTTTWSTLTTIGTGGDLTVNAAAGDVIVAGMWGLTGSEAVALGFDPVTVVGSTVTNSFGMAASAPANWAAFNTSGFYYPGGAERTVSGTLPYTTVAGDISSGTVKVRFRYAMASATNRTLYGASNNPFFYWIQNLGPVTT